jgi:glycosyltransferase involved in cell wall biosynthesis
MIPGLRYGDAISNHVVAIQQHLHTWGYPSDIYTIPGNTDAAMQSLCRPYTEYVGQAGQAVIYHHAIGSELAEYVRSLTAKVILYYHNITPPSYVDMIDPRMARGLELGREQLAYFKHLPYTLAGSEFSRRELLSIGYASVDVLPYFIPFSSLDESLTSEEGQGVLERYGDDRTNWLFIGRLVPNKCQVDLARMFSYYQCQIDSESRLLLVGSDSDTPGYHGELNRVITRLHVKNVELCGHVPQKSLGAYYNIASGYVSMSEHEGFGIPLLEAMYMGVPVIAYSAAAVPDTLGSAGILFHRKQFELIAELLHLVAHDMRLREKLITRQYQRVAEFEPTRITQCLKDAVTRVQSSQ